MKLENQVCSLEQAKKLKDLGVNQIAFFIHDEFPFSEGESCIRQRKDTTHDYSSNPSAFTVSESGIMIKGSMYLPVYMSSHAGKDYWHAPGKGRYDTEAEARAAVLIWLIEKEVVPVEEINQRLQSA